MKRQYAKRDFRLAAYGGVVLQQFEFIDSFSRNRTMTVIGCRQSMLTTPVRQIIVTKPRKNPQQIGGAYFRICERSNLEINVALQTELGSK